MMRDKLGLFGIDEKDKFLILDLLTWMHKSKTDYTNTFCYLMNKKIKEDENYEDQVFKNWEKRWNERLKTNNNNSEKCIKLMRTVNPLVIPRNHKVEEALDEAEKDNLKPFTQLVEILNKPYTIQKDIHNYQLPSLLNEKYQTFCGT